MPRKTYTKTELKKQLAEHRQLLLSKSVKKKDVAAAVKAERQRLLADKIYKKDVEARVKAEVNKIKLTHNQRKLMTRIKNAYKGQETRINKLNDEVFLKTRVPGTWKLEYTREEFIQWFLDHWGQEPKCEYCNRKLTVSIAVADHRQSVAKGGTFTLDNLALVDQSCNWRKGSEMDDKEYLEFIGVLRCNFRDEVVEDIFRRLSIGGHHSKGR